MPQAAAILVAFMVSGQAQKPLERYEFAQPLMGMPFRISLYAPDEAAANAAAFAAFRRIRNLNGVLSDYEPQSEMMRLCRTAGTGQAVPVSEDLWNVLTYAVDLSKKSDGAFDVTIGPVVRLWRKARKTKQFPADDELAAARALVGYKNIRLDPKNRTVELLKPGMQLDFGGIGVGFAVDEALKVLKVRGITRVMIDGSGDIGVGDPPPGKAGWKIGIAALEPEGEPSRFILLKNAAVTTSGDAFQFVEFEGRRYSHIVDPATGLGLTDRSTVTVIAPDCTTADTYAKVVAIMGTEQGIRLLEEIPHAAALVLRAPEGTPIVTESARLKDYLTD
jgi:FAD:protein FMN transferase